MSMPSEECFKDIGELKADIENLKEWRRETDRQIAAMLMADAKKEAEVLESKGFQAGAVWALAKVGAVVVLALSLIGWVTVHGLPDLIRAAFK